MTLSSATYHIPVLLKESIEGLNVSPDGTYADMTFGGGGHSRELLSRLGAGGRLFGFDQDGDAEARVESGEWLEGSPLADDNAARGTFTFVRSNFRYLTNWMRYYGVDHLDGVLADLGVSSHHFDDSSRGFSFRFDAPLDMRMNRRAKATAADILARYDEEELARVFHVYGELKNARRLASAIVSRRRTAPVATTGDLAAVAGELLRRDREKKELAKVFQALRIEVNNEMGALEEMLLAATEMLRPGGRLVVITYHSIEDRMVKNIMKAGNVAGTVEQDFYGRISTPYRLVGKVTVPDDSEQQANPRSRSAKLRIAEKK
ncbi:MAG: 16S rRNA (cytosine(1402)-N(4))-methyltransferase RsmH [Prevotella sp.]|nr:16S rRNA (cytosine(1402)-N(4))-methyltransferase RsmH [Prevotella sp.]